MANLDPDIALVRRVRIGEASAYAEIVERHKDRAMTLAVRILKDSLDAEEALQDAFVRAFRALDRFDERARFSTWFYRILYNVCITRATKRTRQERAMPTTPLGALEFDPADNNSPHTILDLHDSAQHVRDAIAELPQLVATVVTLFYVQEMSHEEIAEITGMPIGTIKTYLHRGRKQLAVLLRASGITREYA